MVQVSIKFARDRERGSFSPFHFTADEADCVSNIDWLCQNVQRNPRNVVEWLVLIGIQFFVLFYLLPLGLSFKHIGHGNILKLGLLSHEKL